MRHLFLLAIVAGCSETKDFDQDGVPDKYECSEDASGNPDDARDDRKGECDGVSDDCVSFNWYPDLDGDGYGDDLDFGAVVSCDDLAADGYSTTIGDCDDSDATVNPGASEVCNGADDDCNGEVDDSATDLWYFDADLDGYGDPNRVAEDGCDGETYLVTNGDDCNDLDPTVNPDGEEVCDDADNDCNGTIDDDYASDAAVWYADSDDDGYGTGSSWAASCDQPQGFVASDTDCDDTAENVYPGATEFCDEQDNDCDGSVDENVELTWYADADDDGYGDAASPTSACTQPTGYVSDASDCDDTDPAASPAAVEECDGQDDDCDGDIDEEVTSTFYLDADGDAFGNAARSAGACSAPAGYVSDATDCDDGDAGAYPGAIEYCNEADDDCDGNVDENDAADVSDWYRDADSDGYGNGSVTLTECDQPSGYVADNSDCDDASDASNPGATEACDGEDNDCDGDIDEESAADAPTWYRDADTDSYGDAGDSTVACDQPSGYVADGSDCDDADRTVNPGANEFCNVQDDDCDGLVDEGATTTYFEDQDGDGYGDAVSTTEACSTPSGYVGNDEDCDDSDASVNPELVWYLDDDGDGFGAVITTQSCQQPSGYVADATDCDDGDSTVNPDAFEACDSEDNDCDGETDEDDAIDAPTWYFDRDLDGYGSSSSYDTVSCAPPSADYVGNADDCNGTRSDINPGATEVCGDGTDQDCDGSDQDCPVVIPDTGDTGDTGETGILDSGDTGAVETADTAPASDTSDSSPTDSVPTDTGDTADTGGTDPGTEADIVDGPDGDGVADTFCVDVALMTEGAAWQAADAYVLGYGAFSFDYVFDSSNYVANDGDQWCIDFSGLSTGDSEFTLVSELTDDGVTLVTDSSATFPDDLVWLQNLALCTSGSAVADEFCQSQGDPDGDGIDDYLFAVIKNADGTISGNGDGVP
jgi:hypothetical protein